MVYTRDYLDKKLAAIVAGKLIEELVDNMQCGSKVASVLMPHAFIDMLRKEFSDEFILTGTLSKSKSALDKPKQLIMIEVK